ncbi:MAG: hypothetical protein JW778_03230 [Candidatus Altiarchaeota archaeon]|nr:hypothetical protein [Candidatus Altiarchaeota archaeon]
MAKSPKKRKNLLKSKSSKPKHNWRNDCTDRRKMLDMKREKYFRFDLEDVLDKSANKDNKRIIAATILNTAAKDGIEAALDYVGRVEGNGLEEALAEEIRRLLARYCTFR